MPTYVYECAKCGDELEIWQSIKDDPLKRHPGSCRGKLTKVIQPAGIVLKGSGFYKNDSGSGSKRGKGSGAPDAKPSESTTSESGASSSSSDSSSGSSDSAPSSPSGDGASTSGSGSGKSGSGSGSSGSGNGSSSAKMPAKTSSS